MYKRQELKTVFNRGFSEGYYLGRSEKEWVEGENNLATEKKILLGKIDHYYPKIKVAEIKLTNNERLRNGDNYLIIGPSTGVIRCVFSEIKMDKNILTFKVEEKVRKNDKLFICRETKNE